MIPCKLLLSSTHLLARGSRPAHGCIFVWQNRYSCASARQDRTEPPGQREKPASLAECVSQLQKCCVASNGRGQCQSCSSESNWHGHRPHRAACFLSTTHHLSAAGMWAASKAQEGQIIVRFNEMLPAGSGVLALRFSYTLRPSLSGFYLATSTCGNSQSS